MMVFCLDNAQYAPSLSRQMALSLGEHGLTVKSVKARVYAINDVLMNARKCHTATQYVKSFENLLPDSFEQLGRQWFRRIESAIERGRAEVVLRQIITIWHDTHLFPPLFTKGLEAL